MKYDVYALDIMFDGGDWYENDRLEMGTIVAPDDSDDSILQALEEMEFTDIIGRIRTLPWGEDPWLDEVSVGSIEVYFGDLDYPVYALESAD